MNGYIVMQLTSFFFASLLYSLAFVLGHPEIAAGVVVGWFSAWLPLNIGALKYRKPIS